MIYAIITIIVITFVAGIVYNRFDYNKIDEKPEKNEKIKYIKMLFKEENEKENQNKEVR